MTSHPLILAAIVSIAASPVSQAGESPPVVLENRALKLEIRQSPAPHVGRLVHKPSGTDLVSDSQTHDLFDIVLGTSLDVVEDGVPDECP